MPSIDDLVTGEDPPSDDASLTQVRALQLALQRERLARQQAEAREARDDAAAARAAMREQQAKINRTVQYDYLALVSHRSFYLPRLLPTKKKRRKPNTKGTASLKSPSSSTVARTSIAGKYYPLKLKRWDACDSLLTAAFQRIHEALADRRVFPSEANMKATEENFSLDLPRGFSDEPLYLTELKTSFFVGETLEKPASRVLDAYLETQNTCVNNRNAGTRIRFVGMDRRLEAAPSESLGDGNTDNQASSKCGGQSSVGQGRAQSRIPVKVDPDCIVLCVTVDAVADTGGKEDGGQNDTEGDEDEDDDTEGDEDEDDKVETRSNIKRIALGEHKAAHKLRAPIVRQIVDTGIAEDYLVQMACGKATGNPAADTTPTAPVPPDQVFYTYALAQTFHYMVSAGILYGYLASGDTLTFLHIPRDDPTTLLYHARVFPKYATGRPEEHTDVTQLSIAGLSGMSLLALEAGTENERWRMDALNQLAQFPKLPESLAELAAAPESIDPPTDGDSGGHDRALPYRTLPSLRPNRPSVASSLRPVQPPSSSQRPSQASLLSLRKPVFVQPSQFDPVSFRPIRPYCSQACLLGLARGLPLDDNCPNVLLHRCAAAHAGSGGITTDDLVHAWPKQMLHPIRDTEELGRLVVLQLYSNILQDCACLLGKGLVGRIGCLFKITLTGYGYTFVAKGVQAFDRRRLQRETAVYKQLASQQGRLVPVYMGMVKLRLPYPRDDGRLVSHLLLLSYGGPAMTSRALARRTRRTGDLAGVDLRLEADRTWGELQQLGVNDDDVDNMDNNSTWCDESRRIMRIDFHCARVVNNRARLSERARKEASMRAEPATPATQASLSVLGPLGQLQRKRSVDWSRSDDGDAWAAKRLRRWESDSRE